MKSIVPFVATMRPAQWVKNLFVAAPVLFAKSHTAEDPGLLWFAVLATVVFILLSGSVYVMNDLLDVERDRLHPLRKQRPLASGRLGITEAVVGSLVILAMAYTIGFFLGASFVMTATAYLLLNVAYSLTLKHTAYVDVLCIASGFLMRILAGCFAIALPLAEISWHLLLCTFLVALFLALGKRRHELATLPADSTTHRPVFDQYELGHIDVGLGIVGTVTAAAYVFYTMSPRTQHYFGNSRLVWSIPFVGLGLLRFFQLLRRPDELRSPTDVMIRDGWFVGIIAGWALVVAWAIYL